jgi:hypothetical protein
MIATRLHILTEIAAGETLPLMMGRAAHYVVGDDLVAALARDDVQKSVLAMIEAGVARLPFSPLLVEFSVEQAARRFVLLEERGNAVDGGAVAHVATLWRDRMADVSPARVELSLSAGGLSVSGATGEAEALACATAMSFALLMLNIRGVEKRVVEVARLNRARRAHGKPRIPGHTLLRIGTVYDREGKGHGGESGRRMPVHLRAGHVRMQACGPEMSERRATYIPPVLVNYREGETARPVRKAVAL